MSNLAPTLSSNSDDWYTPKRVLELVETVAPIAFDPFPINWDGKHDGFKVSWESLGLTFCNPPYSRMKDFAKSALTRTPAIGDDWHFCALVPARPDTAWFESLRENTMVVCFWSGRIKFERGNGLPATSAPFPSVLFYAGPAPGRFCDVMTAAGHWAVRS